MVGSTVVASISKLFQFLYLFGIITIYVSPTQCFFFENPQKKEKYMLIYFLNGLKNM